LELIERVRKPASQEVLMERVADWQKEGKKVNGRIYFHREGFKRYLIGGKWGTLWPESATTVG
jgi:hypothetical protein